MQPQRATLPWSALLSVTGEDGLRTTYPFRHPRVAVGRRRHNDLALPDQNISASHCEFVSEGGHLVVRDLDSINGTWVNERRVNEARLRDGDVVRLGSTRISITLQGEVSGARFFSRRRLPQLARWAAVGLFLVLVLGGVLAWRLSSSASEARLRLRYAVAVRAQVQDEPCAEVAPAVRSLRAVDARIGGRRVSLAAVGSRLNPQDQQANVELLGLYRQKIELYAQALQALSEQQQKERDGLERITRMGARLTDVKDRKVAFWAEGQLADRVAKGETFLAGMQELARQTRHFSELVEGAAVRADSSQGPELAAFRFQGDVNDLLRNCQADFARATSGTLGALNAFDED